MNNKIPGHQLLRAKIMNDEVEFVRKIVVMESAKVIYFYAKIKANSCYITGICTCRRNVTITFTYQ